MVIALAERDRLPAFYGSAFRQGWRADLIRAGHLDIVRRSASYVDRVLRGERPGELPVQGPTKYELLTNLKTVKGAPPRAASDPVIG